MQQQLPLQEASAAVAQLRPTPVIHFVDDSESFRKAVTRLLTAAGYLVQTYASAADFLFARLGDLPGCVLLDVRLPGLSGLDLQDTLAKHQVTLPIIFLTGHGDVQTSVRAMKAGAVDFLTKPVKREELLAAVENALKRDACERASREQSSKWRSRFDALTSREREVFDRVVAGKLNKQIASELGTAERTIKAHRANIMEKMQADSLAHLVHIADLLDPNQAIQAPRPQI